MPLLALPDGISSGDLLGAGTSGVIALDPTTKRVIKFPAASPGDDEERTIPRCEREAQSYEKLQVADRPPSLLEYYGPYCGKSVNGIWLEYAPNGTVSQMFGSLRPGEHLRLLWAVQFIEALEFCHAHNVLHGDLRADNLFLDADLNLKLADFTGASIDGSGSLSFYGSSHLLPRHLDPSRPDPWSVPIDVQTEIFAVGSTLFEIWTGAAPWHDLGSEEREDAFRAKSFPTIKSPLEEVIHQCWHVHFDNMTQILDRIRHLLRELDHDDRHDPQQQEEPFQSAAGKLLSIPSLLLACVTGGLVLWYTWQRHRYPLSLSWSK